MQFYSGNSYDTLIVFDYIPVYEWLSDSKDLRNLGKLINETIRADIVIVGGIKPPSAKSLTEGPLNKEISDIISGYKNIIFSGAVFANKFLIEEIVTGYKIELETDRSVTGLMFSLEELFHKKLKVTRKNKTTLNITFSKLSIETENDPLFPAILTALKSKGTILKTCFVKKKQGKAGKLSNGIYTVTIENGQRFGFTESPKYYRKKIYDELHSVLKRDVEFVRNAVPISDIHTEEVTSLAELQAKLKLKDSNGRDLTISIDIEGTGLHTWEYCDLSNTENSNILGKNFYDPFDPDHISHKIILLSVATELDKGFSFLVHHPRIKSEYDGFAMLKWIAGLSNNKIAHNLKFEVQWIELHYGIMLKGTLMDTIVNEHILHEGMFSGTGRYSLAGLIAMRLKLIPHKADFMEDILTDLSLIPLGKRKDITGITVHELMDFADRPIVSFRKKDFSLMPREDLCRYGPLDAVLTLRVAYDQLNEFIKRKMAGKPEQSAWETLAKYVVGNQSRALAKMEYSGFPVNTSEVETIIEKCDVIIEESVTRLQKEFGDIQFTSNKKVTVLIEERFPALSEQLDRTEKGDLEITKDMEKKYSNEYPWIVPLFALKHAMKVRGTYMIAFLQYASNGKVHFNFNIAGPATGRLSSDKPNVQNIPPVVNDIPVKSCLKPEKGCILINMDLSSAEMRMLANYSKDKALIKQLLENKDPHAFTAAGVYDVKYDDIMLAKNTFANKRTAEQELLLTYRQNAKPLNFGMAYGISGQGLAKQIGCTPKEGDDMIAKFYSTYPGVKTFHEKLKATLFMKTYVETFTGRRRSFPALEHRALVPYSIQNKMVRKAMNYIIQSATSDFLMYFIRDLIDLPGITPHITVHDSIVFSYNEKLLPIKDLYDHFHNLLIVKPKQLWPRLMTIDMKFDLDAMTQYGTGKQLTIETINELTNSGTPVAEWVLS